MAFDANQDNYRDLRDIFAERSDAVVAWVGAGLSMPAGLPSWAGLRQQLVDTLWRITNQLPDATEQAHIIAIARSAQEDPNLWDAFSLLKDKLGIEDFRAAVRRALVRSETAETPSAYRYLWKLRICGVLNLNLDRLAARAFNETFSGATLHSFTGQRAADYIHILKERQRWLVYLHGELDDAGSWVFTASDLRRLMQTEAYRLLINTCFAARTVIFLGISADDVAVGGHLRSLTDSGIDLGGHYWITHRSDLATRDWAQQTGLRLIYYTAIDDDHSEIIDFFDDLKQYVPSDETAPPVSSRRALVTEMQLPTPGELQTQSAAAIRRALNAKAAAILSTTNSDTIAAFNAFAREYSQAIYRAWYVSTDPPDNELLGYTVTEEVASGAFATVYRGHDSNGNQVALKVLHERIRRDPEMLHTFRRGVRSMKILSESGILGVVKYHDASEIPAVVVMDFVEGSNLSAVVGKDALREWSDTLRVACEITSIVRRSHRLPQRVLHRDIRPANIMLENFWGGTPKWEQVRVALLDFDLSWHLDAFDVSVSQPGTANGYLAPEQVERSKTVSTRNAAVDSFGLGMTLYFLRSGRDPRFGEHRYADWQHTLDELARGYPSRRWKSVPNRYARLVRNATKDRQDERLDVALIDAELQRLRDAESNPSSVVSADLVAEEIAERAFMGRYTWNESESAALWELGGVRIEVKADETKRGLRSAFQWLRAGPEHHQNVRKWLPNAQGKIESSFRRVGWNVQSHLDTGMLSGTAEVGIEWVRRNLDDSAAALREVVDALSFT